jgi:hypothetical protein
MKSKALKIFALLTLFVTLAATGVYGQVTAKYDIPFNFVVTGKLLPAGGYTVERPSQADQQLVLIRNTTRQIALFTGSIPIGGRAIQEKSKLVFHRYGNHYFLAQLWTAQDSVGRELIPSRLERQMGFEQQPTYRAMKPSSVVIFALTSQGGGSETAQGH